MSLALDHHSALPASWRPSWFIQATFACHAVALAVVWWQPLWALVAVLANHGLIVAATLWPRSQWFGPNLVRLPEASRLRGEVAITIDDGPDPAVTPQVLDLLAAAGVRASFFCIADQVAAHPALAREIAARGHDIQNHTASHRHSFSFLGRRGYAAELERAQRLIESVTGQRPRCFRAPAGFRNPFLAPVLARLDLALVTWSRRGFDTREAEPQRVLQRLTRSLNAGDILLLHDGHAARTAEGEPVILQVLPGLLERCRAAGLRPVRLTDALTEARAHG
ncbi:polysaccharide deacetylase family protein [Ideonella sp. YS5]|uniref:polysaccharide deacetylase family protein n=1 Tax=Ideonella sp. YS5 TaxID=3453714 RepID=UPI003EEC5893